MKPKVLKVLLCLLGVLPAPAHSLQMKEVKVDGEVEAFIAQDEINRIKVLSDKITKVMAIEGDIEVLDDKDLGEIYVKLVNGRKQPTSIFLITERKATYKVLLLPKKIPAEQIFLQNAEEPSFVLQAVDVHQEQNKIVDLIKAMRAQSFAEGVDSAKKGVIIENNGHFFLQVTAYISENITGRVLFFGNDTGDEIILRPEQFRAQEGQCIAAISIDEAEVAPGESTYVYLVERRI